MTPPADTATAAPADAAPADAPEKIVHAYLPPDHRTPPGETRYTCYHDLPDDRKAALRALADVELERGGCRLLGHGGYRAYVCESLALTVDERVIVVDPAGKPRYGPRGPLRPADRVREIEAECPAAFRDLRPRC